ncbi:MAG: AAA family ATPase [Micrococcaceae bacterium]
MRIHRLEIQAIGPFAQREAIDFDVLNTAGLFLLDGPTGAGKSTVLAAICYALYGSVPGQRKLDSLHSTLAAAEVRPEVQLEVTLSGRRFEILRWPAHQRPAKRRRAGSAGMTTEQAGVNLREQIAGEWVERSHRNDEAGQLLRDVLGLSAEQFMRVVLLPQGEFAAFLQAGSKDRETLLRRLFDTQRFDTVEDWLREQAQQQGAQVRQASEQLAGLRETLTTALTRLSPQDTASDDHTADTAEADQNVALDDDGLISRVEQATEDAVAQAATQRDTARAAAARTRTHHDQLVARAREVDAATRYQARHTQHRDAEEVIGTDRTALARHEVAQPVLRTAQVLQRAHQQLDQAITARDQAHQDASNHPWVAQWAQKAGPVPAASGESDESEESSSSPDAAGAAASVSHWQDCQAEGYRVQERTRRLAEERQRLRDLRERLDQATTRAEELEAEHVRQQQVVTDHLQRRDALSTLIAETDHDESSVSRGEQQLADAQRRLEAAQTAQSAATQLEAARDVLRERIDAAQQATEEWQQALQQRLDQASALLAQELRPDAPCPVCGSVEHPAPAAQDQLEEITPQQLQAAEKRRAAAGTARESAQRDVDLIQSRWETATAASGEQTVDDAETALQRIREQLSDAQRAQQRLDTQRAEREQLEVRLSQLTEQLSEATRASAAQQATVTALSEQVQRVTERDDLGEALDDDTDLAESEQQIAHGLDLVNTLIERLRDADTARDSVASAQRDLAEALESAREAPESGFAAVDDARAAHLEEAVRSEKRRRVQRWDEESAALRELAAHPEVVSGLELLTTPEEIPTPEKTQDAATAVHEAERHAEEAAARYGTATSERDQHRATIAALQRITAESAQRLAHFEELEGLLKVVRGEGENGLKMRLGSYVLAGRLEKVALAASERLSGMTQGRYTIEHDDTAVSGRRAGLDLRIRDHVNDSVRHPSTLSGGESFMTSLALALGLADTVQAEAGGISMDTLFVDEGFGSLDNETLEQVMEVLDGLQASGRAIGLVSHVETMKQQIQHRIEVTKKTGGSHLTVVGPPV